MDDELDSGLDMAESFGSDTDTGSLDVDSFMDSVPEVPEIDEFGGGGGFGGNDLDIDSIMDEVPPVQDPLEDVPAFETEEIPSIEPVTEEIEEVPVTEEVQETEPVTEEVQETEPVTEEVQETEPVTEEIQETEPVTEEVQETEPVTEEIQETEPATEEIQETEPVTEEVQETEPATEEIQETEPVTEEIQETEPVTEEVQETEPVTEEVQETEPVTEEVQETEPVTEEIQETEPVTEEIQETEPVTEEIQETEPVTEEVQETEPVTEEVQETEPVTEEIQETEPVTEEVQETEPVTEEVQETEPATEEIQETEPVTEEIQETEPVTEEIQETEPITEEIQEAEPVTEEVQEEIPAAETAEQPSEYGPGPAQTAMGEYLSEHNYGQQDYAEYSQDPEWQRLNNDLLVELGQEPIDYPAQETANETPDYGPGPAQTAMGEYLSEHNYGQQDYAEYSQDPEWQRLNNDLLVELGQEPIDYPAQETVNETPDYGPGPAQTAMGEYLSEHNYGQQDYAEYSQDPEWQRLNNDLLVELGQEPIDYPAQETAAEVPEAERILETVPAAEENLEEIPAAPEVEAEVQEAKEPLDPVVAQEIPKDPDEITEEITKPTERVYDEFEEMIRVDDDDFYESGTFYTQGINEYGYTGTCGETSMASTMNRVLGTNEYTENKVLDVAVQEGLCDTGSFEDSGGTTTDQFMDLYEKMNETCGGQLEVERHDFENVLSMEEVAQRLEEGCTINVAVDADTLWNQRDPMGSPFPETKATDHWITVTDVHRDENGAIEGFDIIDSGGGESYVDADKYEAMCYGTDSLELTDPTCIVVSRKDGDIPQPVEEVPANVPDISQPMEEVPTNVPDIPQPVEDVPASEVGVLKPNDTYESHGYTYQTDNMGRIVSASGELHLVEDFDRNPEAQLLAGGDDRAETDDGGHLIATRFGGSPDLDNLVAENSFINRSQYKILENSWARDLDAGNRVLVNIEPHYGVDGQRPTHITGEYTVIRPDGSSYHENFSLTNEDLRAPEFQEDYDFGGDSSFYQSLSEADQQAYQEAMSEKLPKIDEGRVFTRDETYEQFSAYPEDSDEAFELQRVIHQPNRKR